MLICDPSKFSMDLSISCTGLSRGRTLRTQVRQVFTSNGESLECGQISMGCGTWEGMEIDPQISLVGGAPKMIGQTPSRARVPSAQPLSKIQLPLLT